jgi:8-oxo-dGTP pyrophosphatase MutT (NUDIX family)
MKNYPVINPETGNQDWVSRSVAVAVSIYALVNGKLCILANKRGKGLPNHAGQWNVVSGYIDYDETLLQACVREVHEETGIDISDVRLELMEIDDKPARENQTILFRYCGFLRKEQLAKSSITSQYAEKDEVDDIKWIPVDDVEQYEWTSTNHMLKIKNYANYMLNELLHDEIIQKSRQSI